MSESFERETLVAEIRTLCEEGLQDFLHYSDAELKKLSYDDLRDLERSLRDLARFLWWRTTVI